MPSTGRPSATRSRSAVVEPAPPQLFHRRARRADARQHGEVGARATSSTSSAPRRRARSRPSGCSRRGSRRRRPSQRRPSSTGCPSLSARSATRSARPTALYAASAMWCASRPVASTWIAMPRRLREARRSARPCRARARASAPRTAGRRGRRPRARARRPSARPRRRSARSRAGRRAPRRAPRRTRARCPRPCGGRRSRGRRRPRRRGRARRGRRAARGSGRRCPAPVATRTRLAPSSASRTRDPRLRGRAQVAHAAAAGGRDGRRPVEHARERLDEQVVVLAVADRDPDPVVEGAHDEPLRAAARRRARGRRRRARRGSSPCDGSGSRPSARSAEREPLALLDHRRARRAATRARRARAPPRASRPGSGAWRAFSSRRDLARRRARSRCARPRARTPSRTCGARSTPSSISGIAVSPQYSKYASSTTSGRASGSGSSAPVGLFGRQVNVSDRIVVADLGAGELRADAVERVRRRRRGSRSCRPGPANARAQSRIRSSAPAPSTTFSGLDAGVAGDRVDAARGSRRAGSALIAASAPAIVPGRVDGSGSGGVFWS